MKTTTARIKKGPKHFEILVDIDEAIKVKKRDKTASLNLAVLTEHIFHNLKSGEHASSSDLKEAFGTTDLMNVAEKIIKEGEIVRTEESMKTEHDKVYKQVIDFLVKNAVSPEGMPYTPDRIMKALNETHINIKNKSVESQISEIMESLSKILPIKVEVKKLKLLIPAIHTGKAYGIIKEFMIKENWLSNGDLEAIVEMPQALIFDFYDNLNSATHGSVLSEEMKE
tara:strand:+ start:24176 stop:24853 length:678 start_codon:yes stop_codon:yes gene_type:complete